MISAIDRLNEDLDEALLLYERNSTPANLDVVRKIKRILSERLLVKRATDGSTLAAIAFYTDNKLTHDISQSKEIDGNYTKEELEMIRYYSDLRKVKGRFKNSSEIVEAFQNAKINFIEAKQHLELMKAKDLDLVLERLKKLEELK